MSNTNDYSQGKTKNWEKNLLHCRFIHHESQLNEPGPELVGYSVGFMSAPPSSKTRKIFSDNRLPCFEINRLETENKFMAFQFT
jgi:hypothetical protein